MATKKTVKKPSPNRPPEQYRHIHVKHLGDKLFGLMGTTFKVAQGYGIHGNYGPFMEGYNPELTSEMRRIPEDLMRFWTALWEARQFLDKASSSTWRMECALRDQKKRAVQDAS
jgi:hypothetical protein